VLPGTDPAGKPTGGAAYDPAKNAWRRIATPPQRRVGANVVWDGRELLVVGGRSLDPKTGASRPATRPLAFNPVTNRWRTLAPIDGRYGREGSGAVWTGTRLLLWGGTTQVPGADPRAPRWALAPYGLAYDPRTDRWTQLPAAPLVGRVEPVAVWTGKAMLVWGGDPNRADVPPPDDRWPFVDGASFTPRRGA
jgi:N-acetylneuraminic acid mutarotase